MKRMMMAQKGRYNADGTTSQHAEMNCARWSNTITTVQKDSYVLIYTPCRIVGRNPDHPTSRQSGLPTKQMIEPKEEKNIIGNITTVQKTLAVLYLILLIVSSLPAATEPQGGMPTMRIQPRSTMPYSIYEWH